MLFSPFITVLLNYDLFVESAGKNGYQAVYEKKKHF